MNILGISAFYHDSAAVLLRDGQIIAAAQEERFTRIKHDASYPQNSIDFCLAGGVALNCVANGKIVESGYFKNVWVQPAAGDAGGALGAAYLAHYQIGQQAREANLTNDEMKGSYLGPEYSSSEIANQLQNVGAVFQEYPDKTLAEVTAKSLSEGRAVGWMQGKMEFGPRALGARSILADPRSKEMQKSLNLKVKYRESFRPFAPSVLREDLSEWFNFNKDSPYMLMVAGVADEKHINVTDEDRLLSGIEKLNVARSEIPAVTHVDNSARIQTVHEETNPQFYRLIKAFKKLTGCPILVNTSFNVRGEPIVCTPEDAFRCFMGTELDDLVIGNLVLKKEEQQKDLLKDYRNKFDLD